MGLEPEIFRLTTRPPTTGDSVKRTYMRPTIHRALQCSALNKTIQLKYTTAIRDCHFSVSFRSKSLYAWISLAYSSCVSCLTSSHSVSYALGFVVALSSSKVLNLLTGSSAHLTAVGLLSPLCPRVVRILESPLVFRWQVSVVFQVTRVVVIVCVLICVFLLCFNKNVWCEKVVLK